jgi:hypothetical protein
VPTLVLGAIKYSLQRQFIENEQMISVTPGSSYAVVVTGTVQSFGNYNVPQYKRANQIILEYFI